MWRVVGVDAGSGYEASLTVRASSEAVARLMAERRGIAVAEIIDTEQEGVDAVRRELENPRTRAGMGAAARALAKGDIICPNPQCGYAGPPKRKAKGSLVLGLLFMLFFIVPGLLYLLLTSGYRYMCPRCGVQVRSD